MGERVRTIRWSDPLSAAAEGLEMSGLEALEAMADGRLPRPPIAELMGIDTGRVEDGHVFLMVEPGEHHYSNTGGAHGGLAATLLDSAMYLAVHATLPAGTFASTLELKINYIRPITVATGTVIADGYVVHRGRQVATAQAEARAPTGKLLAHGMTTCLIRPPAE